RSRRVSGVAVLAGDAVLPGAGCGGGPVVARSAVSTAAGGPGVVPELAGCPGGTVAGVPRTAAQPVTPSRTGPGVGPAAPRGYYSRRAEPGHRPPLPGSPPGVLGGRRGGLCGADLVAGAAIGTAHEPVVEASMKWLTRVWLRSVQGQLALFAATFAGAI